MTFNTKIILFIFTTDFFYKFFICTSSKLNDNQKRCEVFVIAFKFFAAPSMAGLSPLWMQEGSTNKICDSKATSRCRRDEAAEAGARETTQPIPPGETRMNTHAWLSGEMRAPHLIGTRFVL